ncbi:15779_t:CDS:2 [Cetraspora pellucida]|uniref:15779_t:CDS:1 n=1 Tax=Cetraspora pellucida TaxID=1433469 RepID=A0A9N9BMC8_9GLOM|nr:15779_t:CDS:2 [Cetraspora pellucida]
MKSEEIEVSELKKCINNYLQQIAKTEQENALLEEQLHQNVQENIQLKKILEEEKNRNRCLNKQIINSVYFYKKKLQDEKARLRSNYQNRVNENNMYFKKYFEYLQNSELRVKAENKKKDIQLKAMRILLKNKIMECETQQEKITNLETSPKKLPSQR